MSQGDDQDEIFSQTMRIDLSSRQQSPEGKKIVLPKKVATPSAQAVAVTPAVDGSRYQELLQSIYDGALITDLTGVISDANHRALEHLLYERDEICGCTVFDIVAGSDDSLLQVILGHLQEQRFALIQADCCRKDGTIFPAEISVNKLRTDAEGQLCFFIRDVTVRRRAEDLLRTEHNAIHNAGNGIAIVDLGGGFQYVNPAFLKMWGYESLADVTGGDLRGLWREGSVIDEVITQLLEGGGSWNGELIARRVDTTEFYAQVAGAVNKDSDDVITGMVFSVVDVTDTKRAEEAIRQSEKQRVMLESLGTACHHLGQPATVLLVNLKLLQQQLGELDEETRGLLDASAESAGKISEVLHKLNSIETYRTTQYIEYSSGDQSHEERILDI